MLMHPMAAPDDPPATATLRPAPKPARTVYWAEDDLDDQFLIRTAAEGLKPRPELTFFEDGGLLLDAVDRRKPDLVVLDIRMPRLDGLEALRRIRARPGLRHLPVVMFSTAMVEEEVNECKALEVRDFLQKPAHYSEFAGAVARIVGAQQKATAVARRN